MKASDLVVQILLAEGEDSGLESESEGAEGEGKQEEDKKDQAKSSDQITVCKYLHLLSTRTHILTN